MAELLRCNDNDDEEGTWEEEEEEVEAQIGDGGDGGGVVLGDTLWGSKALAIAEEVLLQFKDDLRLYAFKVSHRGYVYVRLDKVSDKYGCPSIDDIKAFHSLYAERLEEAGQGGGLPHNLAVEVSSPGAERFVKVPNELERFKGLPVYVSYVMDEAESKEQNGIFELDSINLELGNCTLKLANVKSNRMNLGKGRTFSRKQKDQSFHLPLCSLKLVRLHMEG
ncbi:uncharacterized protein LOC131049503 isoform X2 [Cryptomeria japonica]|uniref:uncharacterized protein LOC131049503 isoform X2 n=1 Tax=Cryptomeria japonica TaxID=3369 RepID=UPI0025AD12E1|nr:uncharacterized protein LOC131049503 isoform X2 [Cryptomeria japonica]XP_057839554.1 uncharacterized protein LOC131049503 isoform X2 [Cryptomeria japonica]